MKRALKSGTLRFIFIAVVLMLLADHFVFGGKRAYIEEARTQQSAPVRVEPPDGKEYFEAPAPGPVPVPETVLTPPPPVVVLEEPGIEALPDDTPVPPKEEVQEEKPKPKVEKKAFVPHGAPKIAIVIDDLGMDIKRSRQILDLPAPITLAFLPYGTKTRELAKEGRGKGHSLIIHTPMEAMNGATNIGPSGLKAAMSNEELDAAFAKMLTSFDGYEGINNHMGSRLTQNARAMKEIMGLLAEKNLFFLDSKTSGASVGAQEAIDAGVPYAERDVFLDHVDTAEFVNKALRHTEELALRRGYAIAIGHPKDHTIVGLKAWLPTLAAKGIEVVPVKTLLVKPSSSATTQQVEKKAVVAPSVTVDPPVKPEDEKGGVVTPVMKEALPVATSTPAPVQEETKPSSIPDVPADDGVSTPAFTLPDIQLDPLPEKLDY